MQFLVKTYLAERKQFITFLSMSQNSVRAQQGSVLRPVLLFMVVITPKQY